MIGGFDMDLGALRKSKGLSQRQLADKLKVQPSAVSAWENGRNAISDNYKEKIAEILDVFPEDITITKKTTVQDNLPDELWSYELGEKVNRYLRNIVENINDLTNSITDTNIESLDYFFQNEIVNILDRLSDYLKSAKDFRDDPGEITGQKIKICDQLLLRSLLFFRNDIITILLASFDDEEKKEKIYSINSLNEYSKSIEKEIVEFAPLGTAEKDYIKAKQEAPEE